MKLSFAVGAALAALALAACSQAVPTGEEALDTAGTGDAACAKLESGVIRPDSPGIPATPLQGPFLVQSLSIGVDPANPQTFGSLLWSKGDSWISITNFKGPFYLASDENLSAKLNFSPFTTVYSGCRLD
jgi:hypothetical protein